jgi:hypothetical protein
VLQSTCDGGSEEAIGLRNGSQSGSFVLIVVAGLESRPVAWGVATGAGAACAEPTAVGSGPGVSGGLAGFRGMGWWGCLGGSRGDTASCSSLERLG